MGRQVLRTAPRRRGWRNVRDPIGSGPIEAGCKTVVGARLKRSGKRWTREGVVVMDRGMRTNLSPPDRDQAVRPSGTNPVRPSRTRLARPSGTMRVRPSGTSRDRPSGTKVACPPRSRPPSSSGRFPRPLGGGFDSQDSRHAPTPRTRPPAPARQAGPGRSPVAEDGPQHGAEVPQGSREGKATRGISPSCTC